MSDSAKTVDQTTPLIALRSITKAFGEVKANEGIDLDIYRSEVLALLGENGAGKSTLMKILYGFYQADSGVIEYLGKPVSIHSPADARALQIGMVFQTFNLIPAFTVAENIALFFPDLAAVFDMKQIEARIRQLCERYNLAVDPTALVADLSVGDQQKIEIIKLLIADARVLILDEPTRVLAPHEIDALFRVLSRLRTDGYAIILITHKMKEVLAIADRITVLRNGRVAGSLPIEQASENTLVEMMFARKVTEFRKVEQEPADVGPEALLALKRLSTRAEGAAVSLHEIDLTVYPGEIVGVTGVSGNGQRELADVVLGRISASSGEIYFRGEDVTRLSIGDLRRKGLAFIPENPLSMAVTPYMTVLENVAVPHLWRYVRHGGLQIDWKRIRQDFTDAMDRLGFTVPLYALTRSLSGGNLQRMVIAREMAHEPQLILASYLTSGLDVRSAIAAREALAEARAQGAGVLLFSDDLDELFTLSDRLLVLHQGMIRGCFMPAETTFEEIGYLMTGAMVADGSEQ